MRSSRTQRAERDTRIAVRAFWQAVAMGSRPTVADLAELGFPETTYPQILAAAGQVLAHRAAGDHQTARALADQATEALLTDLGAGWAPPPPPGPDLDAMTPEQLGVYLATGQLPTSPDPDDPAGLIAGVSR